MKALLLFLLNQLVEHEDGFGALLPRHQPEVAYRVRQRTLSENIAAVGFFNLNKVRVDVVCGALLKDDPAVVIWADISVAV